MANKLTEEEVREYIQDYPGENLLLDKEEFSDTFINLSMGFAAEEYNAISPRSSYTLENFPSKAVLITGTLWKMYSGKAAQMARNQLSYSDGGLQIPIEEKYELYMNLANNYMTQFLSSATKLKISINMEGGWGEVRSDEAMFPPF